MTSALANLFMVWRAGVYSMILSKSARLAYQRLCAPQMPYPSRHRHSHTVTSRCNFNGENLLERLFRRSPMEGKVDGGVLFRSARHSDEHS